MTIADRWLLPDGVEELLPEQAVPLEHTRRQLLDLFQSWGYQYVIPPLIEFNESLLIDLGRDVALQTFQVSDQQTGRMMGIRADITPQTARIDAHSMAEQGANRLCYAGSVLHKKAKGLLESRSPIQIGAELYGEASLAADTEVLNLLCRTLEACDIGDITLELGHVGIFRCLAQQLNLAPQQEQELFNALQHKASTDLSQLTANLAHEQGALWVRELANLNGDISVLAQARELLADAPSEVQSYIEQLEQLAETLLLRCPTIKLRFDLCELSSYHYHSGIVFSAYTPGCGRAIARGGRYDGVGAVFGRSRPATGFAADLKDLLTASQHSTKHRKAIFAPLAPSPAADATLWQAVQTLRNQGEQVICALSTTEQASTRCDRQLVLNGQQYDVQPLNS